MSHPVQYPFQIIQEIAATIGKARSKVDDVHRDIQSSSASLQADWDSSSAHDGWGPTQSRFNAACQSLKDALDQLRQRTADAGDAMRAQESSNQALWRH